MTCRGDGLGAQLLSRISVQAYATLEEDVTYVHHPLTLKVLQKSHGYGLISNSTDYYEEFFNLWRAKGQQYTTNFTRPSGGSDVEICRFEHCHEHFATPTAAKKGEKGPPVLHVDDYLKLLPRLRQSYWATPKPDVPWGKPAKGSQKPLRVAVHIRRGDVASHKHKDRFTPNEWYIGVMRAITEVYRFAPIQFLVLSQGKPTQFADIVNAVPSTSLLLDAHATVTFHALVSADVLVAAKSSLSYSAGLLSEGLVLYTPMAYHPPLSTWLSYQQAKGSARMRTWSNHTELVGALCKDALPQRLGAECNCSKASGPLCT